MPLATLVFTSQQSVGEWTWVGGATNYTNLNADDADTTYGVTTDNPAHCWLVLDTLPALAAAIVPPVYMLHKDKKITNNSVIQMRIRQGAVEKTADGGNETVSWTTYGSGHLDSYATDANNLVWTVPNFNATSWLYRKTTTGANTNIRVTYGYGQVNWIPSAGSFAYLIGQWLPPLLAVASHCLMKREVAQILGNLKHRPNSDKEFGRLLEAFRVRPVWA